MGLGLQLDWQGFLHGSSSMNMIICRCFFRKFAILLFQLIFLKLRLNLDELIFILFGLTYYCKDIDFFATVFGYAYKKSVGISKRCFELISISYISSIFKQKAEKHFYISQLKCWTYLSSVSNLDAQRHIPFIFFLGNEGNQ